MHVDALHPSLALGGHLLATLLLAAACPSGDDSATASTSGPQTGGPVLTGTTGVECGTLGTWFPSPDDECNSCLCNGVGEYLGCTGQTCDGPCDSGDVLPGACPSQCIEGRWVPVGDDSCGCDPGDERSDGEDCCTCTDAGMWSCGACDGGTTTTPPGTDGSGG